MKIYLSGPMSGFPELNHPLFHSEAARLRKLGYDVVNPAEIDAGLGADWVDYMRADIAALMTCQGIAMLRGWGSSRGASIERQLAVDLEMPVFMAAELREEVAA